MTFPRELDWTAVVAAVGAAFAERRWPERVREWLASEAESDAPWCVALSGGADSVALLLTLWQLRNAQNGMRNAECGFRNDGTDPAQVGAVVGSIRGPKSAIRNRAAPVLALHFNHRLRGAAADGDEAFCRALCAALGVRLVVGAADWPAGSDVSEARAREARFAFFGRVMGELGARALWLGHQRDDVVETMLLRLSRGSGSRGLAAPRPVQRLSDGTVRLRPLLDFSKAEIVAALRAAGVSWREDETNHGDAFFRNRLRRQVIPEWAAAAPAELTAAVARSRELLEEEDEALESWVDRVLPEPLGDELPLAALRAAPVAIARRALHRWLLGLGLDERPGAAAFEEMLAAVRAGRVAKASAGADGFFEVSPDSIRFVTAVPARAAWAGASLAPDGELTLPDGAKVRAARVCLDEALRRRICAGEWDDGRTAFLAMETGTEFLIRHWRDGDRYRPLGSAHATKLQDQFVNRRIPREERRRLPVVCGADGAILWVPGLPPADEQRITRGTAMAVQLTYLPANSLSASTTGHV